MEKIINYLQKNFSYWDVFYQKNKTRIIKVEDGKITNNSESFQEGIGIRLGNYYFATNILDENKIIGRLKNIKTNSQEIHLSSEKGKEIITFEENPEEELKNISDFLKDKAIKYTIIFIRKEIENKITNSNNCDIFQKRNYSSIAIIMYYSKNSQISKIIYTKRSCKGSCFNLINYEELEKKIKILKELVTAPLLKPKKANVVLDPKVAGVLIHEAYGHALEADYVKNNESIFSFEKMGLGEQITIKENPEMCNWGYYKWDDEGFKSKEKILIDRGKIVNYIEDGRFGKGGHGRRESFWNYPIPRMACTILEKGDYKEEELFEEIKNGYLLCGSAGGQVSIFSGTFQFSVKYVYEIKNGEKTRLFKGTSFSDNILEIGHKILGKSKMLHESTGFCGKQYQVVPVSKLAPYVAIKNVYLG